MPRLSMIRHTMPCGRVTPCGWSGARALAVQPIVGAGVWQLEPIESGLWREEVPVNTGEPGPLVPKS